VIRRPRASLTVVLTGAVLVLLPLLAFLQYHWLSQIGEETGSRMRAVALSAAEAMSVDLAFEVGQAWRERVGARDGAAARRDSSPLVVDALVVDGIDGEPARARVRRWNLDAQTCEPAEWPANYGSIRDEGHRLLDQLQWRSASLGIVPMELPATSGATPAVRPACDVAGSGMVVFRVDPGVLRRVLLPEVARRHLDALEGDDFFVAIVSGPMAQDVIYASAGADAAAVAARPDAVFPLTLARADRPPRGSRGRGGREGPVIGSADGRGRAARGRGPRGEVGDGWLFVAQHRAGSLESAVARLRARNLAVSLGILSLLGVAVAMIAANARRAERLGRQQVEFVAAVSHEMRTPVTGIELAARNLEDGLVVDPARVQRYGGVIRTEARRLAETVERVLQFAALEAGRGVGPAEDVDVTAVIEDVVARARSEHRQATIELDLESPGHVIRSDTAALRSAVQNLLANALKYGGTPAWARVRVEQTRAVPPELFVTVEDRGPGIDPHDVPHVFEAFYRGRLATERRTPGNGLGLHIVKRSIEALGGRVSLRTEAGTGTTVTLHLPLPAAMDADDGEPTTPAAGR
jgi:signal transduction histidine kinase